MPYSEFDNQNDGMYDTYDENKVLNKRSVKKGHRRYYPSNSPDKFVRNAQTGIEYSFKVGSREQNSLFKSVDTTGVCDEDGYVIHYQHGDRPNPNTNHLFYDTPEQCMRHLGVSFERSFIEKWHENRRSDMEF